MNRREIIKTAALAGLGSITAAGLKAAPIFKKEGISGGSRTFRLGELELSIFSDGHLFSSPIQPLMTPRAPVTALKKLLKDHFRPTDSLDIAMNVLLVRSGKKLILIDPGMGKFADGNSGRLMKGLTGAGITASEITDVVLSHAHPDHIGGLVSKSGALAFPNSAIHINKVEFDFWIAAKPADFARSGIPDQTEFLTGFIDGIKRTLQQVRPKMKFIDMRKPLFDTIRFQEAPGHTPGSTIITVYSDDHKLTYIADLVHSDILLFAHPEWGYGGDRDIDEGIATRIKVLGQLADAKERTFGFHLPWPGTGHVRRSGNSFKWVPEVFTGP